MSKLKLIQEFTVQVPQSDGTFKDLKGKLYPLNAEFKRELKEKFKDTIDKKKEIERKNNKLLIVSQKLQNVTKRLELKTTLELLEEQATATQDYEILMNKIEELTNDGTDYNITELQSKEHILKRVRADDETRAEIIRLCDEYGYALMYNTILEDAKEGK